MSSLPALPMLMLLLAAPVVAQGPSPVTGGIRVHGTVELSPLEAARAAELAAVGVVWNRFRPVWIRDAGRLVPENRLEQEIRDWLVEDFERLGNVRREPMEVRETTAGKAYRQALRVRLDGPQATKLRQRGTRCAMSLSRRFRGRFALIGAVWVILLFGSFRVDRATQGYLTGRIRLAALAMAVLAAVLIYP